MAEGRPNARIAAASVVSAGVALSVADAVAFWLPVLETAEV